MPSVCQASGPAVDLLTDRHLTVTPVMTQCYQDGVEGRAESRKVTSHREVTFKLRPKGRVGSLAGRGDSSRLREQHG